MNSDELFVVTGLMLPSLEAAQAQYEANRPIGSPEFSVDVLPHLRACNVTRKWEDILREREIAELAARRALDPTLPLYGTLKFHVPEDQQHLMDECATHALESFDQYGQSIAAAQVFLTAAKLVALLHLVPVHHESNSADFLWAKLRVVYSGGGWRAWSGVAQVVAAQYPNCPWDPAEDEATWKAALVEAHSHCGWPVQLTHMRWPDVCRTVAGSDDHSPWHRVAALFHALKHIRYDAPAHTLVVLHTGTATRIELGEGVNTIEGHTLGRVLKALGGSAKSDNPLQAALTNIIGRINVQHFIQLAPLSSLTPDVLCGPWSTLRPDPNNDGFFQFGLALDGVWLARQGRVRPEYSSEQLISEYNWNIVDPLAYDMQRADFQRALPQTYEPQFPADYFISAFSNLVLNHFEADVLDAAATLFDTPIVANLLRPFVPELRNEFPLVVFLPQAATQAHSTNQGKTYAAEAYGRATVPGIEAKKIKEGDSAPDSRAAMDSIQRFGTAVLDEFYMPESKSHILCRDNIQSLCVGKPILAGMVYENSGSVRLAYSLTISAKAFSVNPDIINRSLFWFLDSLTEEARANAENLDAIVTGKLSLQMRLGAWAIIEQNDLINKLKQTPKASSPEWRFGCHRALATLLYGVRQKRLPEGEASPLTAAEAIDRALTQMRARHHEHTMEADDAGLLTMLAEGKNITLSLRAIFDGLGIADVQHIADWMLENGNDNYVGQSWAAPKQLLEGRHHIAGLTGRPLAALLPALTGKSLASSDRMVCQLLADEIRRMVPEGTAWVLPDHLGIGGWKLHRGNDRGGGMRLRLTKENPK
jgi:hypothetical protein